MLHPSFISVHTVCIVPEQPEEPGDGQLLVHAEEKAHLCQDARGVQQALLPGKRRLVSFKGTVSRDF